MKRWLALGGALAFTLFRLRWWRRCHYHSLIGRTVGHEEMVHIHCALVDELERVFRAQGVTWWMEAGTLLGAWRHSGYIPWDDDMDICVMHADHQRILNLPFAAPYRMIEISRIWSVDKGLPGIAKVWPCRTYLRLLDPRTQLYVDIFEAQPVDDRLEILPLSLMHPTRDFRGQPWAMARDLVFPLGQLPFEGRMWPAPARPKEYLQAHYGGDLEPSHVYREGRWVSLLPRRWKI